VRVKDEEASRVWWVIFGAVLLMDGYKVLTIRTAPSSCVAPETRDVRSVGGTGVDGTGVGVRSSSSC
jgi:hypothetical protein